MSPKSSVETTLGFPFASGEMADRVRRHGWENGPLGPLSGWSAALRTAAGLMLNARQPMFLLWGDSRSFLYNDAYISILGARHPKALGQPMNEIWPEIYDEVRKLIDPAFEGQPVWAENVHRVINPNGYWQEGWYTLSYTPLHEADGAVAGVFCAVTDTTEHVVVRQRQSFLLTLSEQLGDCADPVTITEIAARELALHLGVSRVGYGEVDLAKDTVSVHRDWSSEGLASLAGISRPLASFGPDIIAQLRAGQILRLNDMRADPRSAPYADGYEAIGIKAALIAPLIRDGRFTGMLFLHEPEPRDWTEGEAALAEDVAARTWSAMTRARAEASLLESESRFRSMADQAPAPIWVTTAGGEIEFVNQAFGDYAGTTAVALLGNVWLGMLHPDDLPGVVAARAAARQDNEAYDFEARFQRSDGAYRTMLASARPRVTPEGRFEGYVGLAIDLTEMRAAEQHQKLLINELNHRVKNTLATVQSIAHQTLRDGAAVGEARGLLTERLLALSAAHNVLTRESWDGAELSELASAALRPFEAGRYSLEGPACRVGPKAALAVSMALHELATNAQKYGALSTTAGSVAVTWAVGPEGALTLTWRETDGPVVVAPARAGFGSRLLRQGLATELGGSTDLRFEPGGVICIISAKVAD